MKIDTNTINVLKNFAKINPSILIEEGNVIKTISPAKTIMAKAVVSTAFPNRFAIYNLDRFISILSLFSDPELIFGEKSVKITDGKRTTNYAYADESTIKKSPEKDLVLPSIDASFFLSNDHLKDVEKALGVLGLPELVILGAENVIALQAADTKNTTEDYFSIDIGETDKIFKAIFKSDNIKILPGDYQVSICSRGISHFVGKEAEYWIAVESNSEF
jgi:hypothetical protein